MARKGERPRAIRRWMVAALLVAALGLLLTRCPANRDGAPGQLAQAVQESTSAARTGALALEQYQFGRSTTELAAVQISDAREQAVKSYQGIAELRVDDPVDVARQRTLTQAITGIVDELSSASAAVRGLGQQPALHVVRDRLLAAAAQLESGYH